MDSVVYGGGDQEHEQWRRRVEPPTNELGQPTAVRAVLGRTEDAVVALQSALAYSTGVLLSLVVLCRNSADPGLMWQRHLEATEGQLMIGIEFPDGRRCSNLGGPDVELDDDAPRLVDRGGGGGGQSYEFTYWLTPLPPPGTLKLVCRCTAVGIDETVTELDTAPLLDAAAGAEILWPWSPPDQHPPEPPALDLPEDSWFRRPR